jgi:hypothetical protein
VAACRAGADDLRAAVKAARSHREKSVGLLAAAAEAVLGLEDVLYSPAAQGPWERRLTALAGRVQAAIDQGEAVVVVHGQEGGLAKAFARLAAPSAAADKYDAASAELLALAAQARSLLAGPPPQAAAPPQAAPAAAAPPQALPAAAEASFSGAAAAAPPPPPAPSPPPAASDPAPRPAAARSSVVLGGRELPAAAAARRRLRRGSRQESATALVYVPPGEGDAPGAAGRAWWHVSRVFGADRLAVHDLSSGVEQIVEGLKRGEGPVTCMHLDDRGIVWTGHRSGAVV